MTMATTLDRSVEADIRAISRIKGLYCDTIDRIVRDRQPEDEGLLRSLFAEDAVIDFTLLNGNVYDGREAIMKLFLEDLPSVTGWMWHTVGAEVIDVDGDTGRGRWTLHAQSRGLDLKGPTRVTFGRYRDEFRRDNGVWRQTKIFFNNETFAD
jgi:hypothetical protein